jgi:hypothetical protein
VRGGNKSAEQMRPFLSATNFIMGLSHKPEQFQGHFPKLFSRPGASQRANPAGQPSEVQIEAGLSEARRCRRHLRMTAFWNT